MNAKKLQKNTHFPRKVSVFNWLREPDLNRRPPGYEFREAVPIAKLSFFVKYPSAHYTEISLFSSRDEL